MYLTRPGSTDRALPKSLFSSASSTTRLSELSRLSPSRKTAKAQTLRDFIREVAPWFKFYPHVEILIAVLQRVADGELHRVMVFLPPRHGKSELVSRLFSAYYLKRYPNRWVGLASYGADLAYTMSRAARENYRAAGGGFATEGVENWETGKGGGMWAAGVGGPATGRGYSLGIIDDVVKNAEEAASETVREKQRDWWRSTFYTRQSPEAAIVIMMTRWHENDLAGWLLSEETSEDRLEAQEGWYVVRAPALSDGSTAYVEITVPAKRAALLSLSEGQIVPSLGHCFPSSVQ